VSFDGYLASVLYMPGCAGKDCWEDEHELLSSVSFCLAGNVMDNRYEKHLAMVWVLNVLHVLKSCSPGGVIGRWWNLYIIRKEPWELQPLPLPLCSLARPLHYHKVP
jgi:hypothetical protein